MEQGALKKSVRMATFCSGHIRTAYGKQNQVEYRSILPPPRLCGATGPRLTIHINLGMSRFQEPDSASETLSESVATVVDSAPVRHCVVGAGIVGLSVAWKLIEQNKLHPLNTVTVIADRYYENTTSYGAGGLWEPYQIGLTDEILIRKWGQYSYQYFLKLYYSTDATETGIQLIPSFTLFEEGETCDLPTWKDIVIGFQVLNESSIRKMGLPSKYTSGYTFLTMTVQQKYYLMWLKQLLEENNVIFITKKISSLDDVMKEGYHTITNCCGLGGASLCDEDRDTYPIRGQVIRVHAPWMTCNWNFGKYYIIPNVDNVVLGGTAQVGNNDEGINDEDTASILNGVCQLFPAFQRAKIECIWVGIRPGRSTVRCESTLVGSTIISHCYGHGGCGITLAMGCAEDLVNNQIMSLMT